MRSQGGRILAVLILAGAMCVGFTSGAGAAAYRPAAVAVPIADNPHEIQVSPTGRYAYVASGDDVVSVVDLRSKKLIKDLPVGTDPLDLVLNSLGSILYVANAQSGTISVVDTRTLKVVRTLSVDGFLNSIDVRPAKTGDELFVSDFTGGFVMRVDARTGAVMGRWQVAEPGDVVVTSDGHVVAPSAADPSVLVINLADGSSQVLQRPDGADGNPNAAAGYGTDVALPGDGGTVWFSTRTMTFTGQIAAIDPGVTSGSSFLLAGRYTLLTTRDPVDADPRVPGNISLVRNRDRTTLAVLPVGVGPEDVAVSPAGLLVTQGPAHNGQFDLLIIPYAALLLGS